MIDIEVETGDVVVWQSGYFWGIGVSLGSFIWADHPSHHCIITDYGQYARRHRRKYDKWYEWYIKEALSSVRWKPDCVIPIGRFINDKTGGNDD
jgi:hypothetical protein